MTIKMSTEEREALVAQIEKDYIKKFEADYANSRHVVKREKIEREQRMGIPQPKPSS